MSSSGGSLWAACLSTGYHQNFIVHKLLSAGQSLRSPAGRTFSDNFLGIASSPLNLIPRAWDVAKKNTNIEIFLHDFSENQKTFLKKAKKFFDGLCGLHHIPRIIVVTDGCDMGRDICALYPGGQAVWQLDWWHLWNYVHKGCKFEKDLEKKVWDLLNVEKVDEALGLLCAYREAMKCMEKKLLEYGQKVSAEEPSVLKPTVFWSSHQLEHLQKLITYLSRNRDGIYGVKAFVGHIPAEYLPFGSGPVERLQAVMIAYRMKKQGKHWSVEGADNLIQLLSREWNGENLEKILEEGIEGISAWDELCRKGVKFIHEENQSKETGKKKKRMDFSPRPAMCVPILKRGRTDSFYVPLKGVSNLKMIPHIVDFVLKGA